MFVFFVFKKEQEGERKEKKTNELKILRPVKDDEVLVLLG